MPSLPWTDERVESLKALWRSGLSASQVAARLGGVTRNAVIGKLHRLGVGGRGAPSAPRTGPRCRQLGPRALAQRKLRPRLATPIRSAAPSALVADAPPIVRDLTALAPHACRWPIGDPKSDDFGFCGRAAPGDGPYCADHARRAYRSAAVLDADPFLRRLIAGRAA